MIIDGRFWIKVIFLAYFTATLALAETSESDDYVVYDEDSETPDEFGQELADFLDSSLHIDYEGEKDDNAKTELKTDDKEPPEVEDLDLEAVPDEADEDEDNDDDDIMSPDHEEEDEEEEELEHEIEITRVKIEAVIEVNPPHKKGKVENSNQLSSNPTELRKASPIDDTNQNHKVISGNIIVEGNGSIGGKENETEKNKRDETEKGASEKEEIKKPTENQVLVSSIKGSHGQTNSTDKENSTTNSTDISANEIPKRPLETPPEAPPAQAPLQQQLLAPPATTAPPATLAPTAQAQAPPESTIHQPLPPAPAPAKAPPRDPPLSPAPFSDNEKADKNNDSEKSSPHKEEVKSIVKPGEKLMHIHKAYGKEVMRSSSKGQLGRKAAQMRENDGHAGAGDGLGNPYMYAEAYRGHIGQTVFRKPEHGAGWTEDTDHDNLASQDKNHFYGALIRVCIILGIGLSIMVMCCFFFKCLQKNNTFHQNEFGYSYTSKRQALDSSSSYLEEEYP